MNRYTDYSKLFYRIENIVTYSLILFYILFLLILYFVISLKQGSFFKPIDNFVITFIRPVASIIWITYLFLYISILIIFSFYSETYKDFFKLKKQIREKRFTIELETKYEIVNKRILPLIPFYETFFMPRFRENPALNAIYMFYPSIYIIALIYIIIPVPALIVEYWEGRIIEIISIIYFFVFRILSRIISLLILSKLTTGRFKNFIKFKENVLNIKINNKTRLLYLITKE